MKQHIKKNQIKTLLRVLVLVFTLIFLVHWGYSVYSYVNYKPESYTTGFNGDVYLNNNIDYMNNSSAMELSKQNIASRKVNQVVVAPGGIAKNILVDHKYEKTASMASETTKFDEDNDKLQAIISELDAVIQQENQSGLSGSQQLYLVIGVMPEKFDDLVEKSKKIGKNVSFNVQQVDKTQQYLELMASKETLEASKESYKSLKEMATTVEERIKIEEKILDFDRQIREIGVDIGLFSDNYSFCTVNIELREVVEVKAEHSITVYNILNLAKESLIFTIFLLFQILLAVCFIMIATIFIVYAYNYISSRISDKKEFPEETDSQNNKISKK